MTDQHETGDGEQVLTLQQLIRSRMDDRGWTYGDLEKLSGGRVSKGRWGQLGVGMRQERFPTPDTLSAIADTLQVDITTVVLAAAQSVGLDARRRGPDLAQLLPTGTDHLSERTRSSVPSRCVIPRSVAPT